MALRQRPIKVSIFAALFLLAALGSTDGRQFATATGSTPLTSAPVWVRQGQILANKAAEPSVIYENSCTLITGPCFRIWFSGTGSNFNGICYAEASLNLSIATKQSTCLVQGGQQSFVLKNSSTYYMYVENANGCTQMCVFTSNDGLTWTQQASNIVPHGTSTAWDCNAVNNMAVLVDGATWRMLYEANNAGCGTGGSIYHCGEATSTDGISWTKSSANPVSTDALGCSGPMLFKINGVFWNWGHTGPTFSLPSDVYRYTFTSWDAPITRFPTSRVFQRGTTDEGIGSTSGQTADPFLIEVSGNSYLFYAASPDGNSSFTIKVAKASMTIAQLTATAEGMTTFTP